MPHEQAHSQPTFWDRIGVWLVAMLLTAFLLGVMGPLISSASADHLSGTRDDGSGEVVASDEDEDDDDQGTDSGESSIGTHSGNTATGTTQGTGASVTVSNSRNDRSAKTATGTTRGTGPSRSISNSS